MAKNYIQEGKTVTLTAPSGGVESGKGYKVGSLFVIADHDALEGEPFEGHTTKVWNLPKVAADAPAEGAKAYFVDASKSVSTVATGNTLIGVFTEARVNGDTEAYVRLNGTSV